MCVFQFLSGGIETLTGMLTTRFRLVFWFSISVFLVGSYWCDLWSCIFDIHTLLSRLLIPAGFQTLVTSRANLVVSITCVFYCIVSDLVKSALEVAVITQFQHDIKQLSHLLLFRVVCFNIHSSLTFKFALSYLSVTPTDWILCASVVVVSNHTW